MTISQRLLNDGESVVISTRTHVKSLLLPALVLVVAAGLAGYLSTLPSGGQTVWWRAAIWGVALLLVLWFSVRPFARWLTTTYTFTDRGLITREGVLTRRGHDISLARVSDISYEKDLLDRVLGCGTLIISDAGDLRIELTDIPRVEETQRQVAELLHQHHR